MTEQQNVTTPDPITTGEARVMVRQTATGFEQGIAGLAGLFTAGPLGALAAWGALRGLQGKWAPWFVLGIPAAPTLLIAQFAVLGAIGVAVDEAQQQQTSFAPVTQNYTAPVSKPALSLASNQHSSFWAYSTGKSEVADYTITKANGGMNTLRYSDGLVSILSLNNGKFMHSIVDNGKSTDIKRGTYTVKGDKIQLNFQSGTKATFPRSGLSIS